MRLLITGAAGYIGSVVTDYFVGLGSEVVALDNLSKGHREAVHPKATLIVCDLLDKEKIIKLFESNQFDAVIHLAAEALIDESVRRPGLFFDVNVTGGLNILNAMASSGVKKFIFSSTAAVYGEPEKVPIGEEAKLNPVNPYGESKLQFERILPWFRRAYGIEYVLFRYFNACGATKRCGEDRKKETHIIPILFDVVQGKRKSFSLFGSDYPTIDGTCIRDYVHVEDIAEAHYLALEKISTVGGAAYNLGSQEGYTNRQVIEAVEKVTKTKIKVVPSDRREGDPAQLVAASNKARQKLNWKPKFTDINDMVRSSWKWRLAHPDGYRS